MSDFTQRESYTASIEMEPTTMTPPDERARKAAGEVEDWLRVNERYVPTEKKFSRLVEIIAQHFPTQPADQREALITTMREAFKAQRVKIKHADGIWLHEIVEGSLEAVANALTHAAQHQAVPDRAKFESWFTERNVGLSFDRDPHSGAYLNGALEIMWQAERDRYIAHLEAAPPPPTEKAELTDEDMVIAKKLIEQFQGWGSSLFDDQQMRGLPRQMKQDCRVAADLLDRLTRSPS